MCGDDSCASRRVPAPETVFRHSLQAFFVLFIHHSHANNFDHGQIMFSPFPVRCPRNGNTLQTPSCTPPRPAPGKCGSTVELFTLPIDPKLNANNCQDF